HRASAVPPAPTHTRPDRTDRKYCRQEPVTKMRPIARPPWVRPAKSIRSIAGTSAPVDRPCWQSLPERKATNVQNINDRRGERRKVRVFQATNVTAEAALRQQLALPRPQFAAARFGRKMPSDTTRRLFTYYCRMTRGTDSWTRRSGSRRCEH